jgi:hypothetical protein
MARTVLENPCADSSNRQTSMPSLESSPEPDGGASGGAAIITGEGGSNDAGAEDKLGLFRRNKGGAAAVGRAKRETGGIRVGAGRGQDHRRGGRGVAHADGNKGKSWEMCRTNCPGVPVGTLKIGTHI